MQKNDRVRINDTYDMKHYVGMTGVVKEYHPGKELEVVLVLDDIKYAHAFCCKESEVTPL